MTTPVRLPPPFPLTKTLHLLDYAALDPELSLIDQYRPLHRQADVHRRWEYAMVVHAMGEWLAPQAGWTEPRLLLDVGGCASQLPEILAGVFPERFLIQVIDPGVNHTIEASPLGDGCAAVITCVSVLEHVEKWKAFLRATVRHLAPGGLLVLTMDYWDCEGPDTAHFHWMRRRIYNRASVTDLLNFLRDDLGCRRFGGVDWRFHGNHVYNYSFLATALIKDPLLLKESQP